MTSIKTFALRKQVGQLRFQVKNIVYFQKVEKISFLDNAKNTLPVVVKWNIKIFFNLRW